jgi:hypothetical protein
LCIAAAGGVSDALIVAAAAAAVARGDVQVAVNRAESNPTGVVVDARLNETQNRSEAGVGDVGIRGNGVLANVRGEWRHGALKDLAAVVDGHIHIELPVIRVIGMERHSQKTTFAFLVDVWNRKKRRGFQQARFQVQDPDRAGMLGDEQPGAVARRRGDIDRANQAAGHAREAGDRSVSFSLCQENGNRG